MAATRTSRQAPGKLFKGRVPMHRIQLSRLLAEQKAYDEFFLPVLGNHESAITLGQMAAEARSEGAPSNAVLSVRIWAASAKRRGLVSTPSSSPNSICLKATSE